MVVAVWPNNTISLVKMEAGFSAVSLFNELDQIANPTDATCYILKPSEDGLCVNFDYEYATDDKVGPDSKGLRLESHQGRLKKYLWPKTVWRDWLRTLERNRRRTSLESTADLMTSDEISGFPSPPTKTFCVDDVRRMKAFSGVYFAFNDDGTCHYVGEAKSVPARVSRSRPEIADRMIGVIRCEPHERKRIESYFIGLLDPPGNSQSTARMKRQQEQKNLLTNGDRDAK
jgi:hypothetical protein